MEYVENTFGYNLHRTIAEIRPDYSFDVSCQGSVPEAIIAFLEGNSFDLWSSGHLNPFKESMAGCDTGGAGEQGESSRSFGDSWPWVRCRLFTVSNTSNLAHH